MKAVTTRLLCLFAILFSGITLSHADQELLLKQTVGPLLSVPGDYFAMIDHASKDPERNRARIAYLKQQLDSDAGYERQLERIKSASVDHNAETYMRSIDGYLSTSASYTFFTAMYHDKAKDPVIMNEITLPDGTMIYLNWSTAIAVHAWSMDEIDKATRAKTEPTSVAGNYSATFSGECPFQDGAIEIKQDNFNIEGYRDNTLLLWGRLGETQVYMQLAETKYAEVYGPREKATAKFPTRPSDIYRSRLDLKPLVFKGIHTKNCTVSLSK